MCAERRIVLAGNIRPRNFQLGENYFDRRFRRDSRTRLELRESAAGSNPHRAVGFLGERVQIAIVPCQSVAGIEVAPARPVPHVDAPLRPRPHVPRGVEFEKINQSVAALPLHSFFDRQPIPLQMNPVDPTPEPVPHPHFSVGARTQRQHLAIAQHIVARKIFPVPVRKCKEPVRASRPHRSIAALSDGPDLPRRQLFHARKLLIRRRRQKKSGIGRSPKSLLAIESQRVCRFPEKTLRFAKPLHRSGSWMKSARPMRLGADPQIRVLTLNARRGAHSMHRKPIQPRNFRPSDSSVRAHPAQQPTLSTHPNCPVGLRLNLIHNVAGQPARRRITLPLQISAPLR